MGIFTALMRQAMDPFDEPCSVRQGGDREGDLSNEIDALFRGDFGRPIGRGGLLAVQAFAGPRGEG